MCAKLTKKTKKTHQVKLKDSLRGLEVPEKVGKLLLQK